MSTSEHPLQIQHAVQNLSEGKVVGMPTETVYGLAARIDLPQGIEAIFKTKERPFFDPLIVHISDQTQLKEVISHFPHVAKILADHYWPGPLTLILPKHPNLNPMITSGLDTVGVRMPSHPIALELIRAAGVPLAAPSANKFGKTSPTKAAHVREEFKKEHVFVLEGGESEIGIESAVLLVKEVSGGTTELSILRKGHVLRSDLEKFLASKAVSYTFVEMTDKKTSPGQMKHHYMPAVPFIVCTDPKITDSQLKFIIETRMAELPEVIEEVSIVKPTGEIKHIENLVLSEDPIMAARQFYSQLRQLAALKPDCLVLHKLKHHSTERWESLFDRINKAASLIV